MSEKQHFPITIERPSLCYNHMPLDRLFWISEKKTMIRCFFFFFKSHLSLINFSEFRICYSFVEFIEFRLFRVKKMVTAIVLSREFNLKCSFISFFIG